MDEFKFQMCLVPHGKKMAVKDLEPGVDPANPPLTDKAKEEAKATVETMEGRHGKPCLIVQSTLLRAQETAAPAVAKFVSKKGGIPLLTLDDFGQPDSGDADPNNPKADHRGLVIYGEPSGLGDWWTWFHQSLDTIARVRPLLGNGQVWGFTHRPMAAMARWIARNGRVEPKDPLNFGELDPDLFPYVRVQVLYSLRSADFELKELPRE